MAGAGTSGGAPAGAAFDLKVAGVPPAARDALLPRRAPTLPSRPSAQQHEGQGAQGPEDKAEGVAPDPLGRLHGSRICGEQ